MGVRIVGRNEQAGGFSGSVLVFVRSDGQGIDFKGMAFSRAVGEKLAGAFRLASLAVLQRCLQEVQPGIPCLEGEGSRAFPIGCHVPFRQGLTAGIRMDAV